ncbi:acetyl-CoA carboxylase biotin carboxylase subunit [Saccharomonospora sp. NPDC046836]|uniref:acetyl-CoA carboxylase biotin carboxylase subunit n=1 Tax=Saccharomonospora sp. NPDC046836 TaxID=3156921 RepID=UPI003402FCA9
MTYFSKVLVANRGEIAVRIIRTLDNLGIASVAVYSSADADAVHVRRASEAVLIGEGPVAESYLRIDRIIEAALTTGAEAIHPGYGLLSENPELVRACEEAGIVFIGPTAEAMSLMGSKVSARHVMRAAGVPIVPGSTEPVTTASEAARTADAIGYPVAVKASGAGGGKGFRVAKSPQDLERAIDAASSEGQRFFGNPEVYLERYLHDPRHIEVQVLGDASGSVIHLFERDCSVQRRHQKLVEETPAPHVDPALRERIWAVAVDAARAIGYRSAGTVEGLLDGEDFYFLEMNTRVQVEHGVTEMVTGVDIVAEQIRIAAGQPLTLAQSDIHSTGHAIECRVNAENPARRFMPSPGTITAYEEPHGSHIRVDSGIDQGSAVPTYYDPLLAKVLVIGQDRADATTRMIQALDEFTIEGVDTLISFHRALLSSPQWKSAETCRDLIEDRAWLTGPAIHGR